MDGTAINVSMLWPVVVYFVAIVVLGSRNGDATGFYYQY
jgi:hypothetical protein